MAASATWAAGLVPVEVPAAEFVLTLWTADPGLARAADRAGVQRIGLDLESAGKARRQRGLGTWISDHRPSQLDGIRAALRHAALFARTDPIGPGTRGQVRALLDAGVEVLMLPMFTAPGEVARFCELVAGAARVVGLLETVAAAERIEELIEVPGLDEIHVGINDLALSAGVRNRFEVLCSPLVERVARTVTDAGMRLGVGAIGRLDDPRLPIAADLLYARYADLGASAALIARTFVDGPSGSDRGLSAELSASRSRLAAWAAAPPGSRTLARRALRAAAQRCEAF